MWFADGTFKSVPNIFTQLYTIHGNISSTVYPLICILICKKNENSYSEVLNQINILKPNLQPKSIVMDFEQAFIKSFKELNSDVTIYGYVIFAHEIKKLSALAFVPVDNVISAFEELINSDYYVENEENLQTVVDYFEDTWIGRLTRGGSPRTNNAVEGWHRAFNSALGANHITVWKFINMLKREQGLQKAKMEQQIAGVPQQKKRRKYKDLDERLVAVGYFCGDILVWGYFCRDILSGIF
ncbi:MULE domain-containing protein [Aphis craccivora]|uniref:MULE domain-containing protein n=1 Tax=Aphis craccivora TaxID=307492 RepID=A0A6G0Y5L0_APHCR|nr:MULE domain-containing protein [Aphis craccivora]